MSPERYRQVSGLYHAALEQQADRRAAFLHEGCAGDEELRREVESLLAAQEQAVDFMATATAPASTTGTMCTPPVPALVGRTLGSYEVLSLLGAGGMGEVYLARDTRLGRRVAIKLLPNKHCIDPERVWRFEREARAASALNHPNIVTLYDIGIAGEGRFIVMEFVGGAYAAPDARPGRHTGFYFTDRRTNRESVGCCACRRHYPSRRQAGQPDRPPRWPREGVGLRTGAFDA